MDTEGRRGLHSGQLQRERVKPRAGLYLRSIRVYEPRAQVFRRGTHQVLPGSSLYNIINYTRRTREIQYDIYFKVAVAWRLLFEACASTKISEWVQVWSDAYLIPEDQ